MLAERVAEGNIIFANQPLSVNVRWEVLAEESLSWHNYILFSLEQVVKRKRQMWNTGRLDVEAFKTCITNEVPLGVANNVEDVTSALQSLRLRFTPHIRVYDRGNAVYWWTLELAATKRKLNVLRRILSSERRITRGRRDTYLMMNEFMEKVFRKTIKKEKGQCWKKLQEDLQ